MDCIFNIASKKQSSSRSLRPSPILSYLQFSIFHLVCGWFQVFFVFFTLSPRFCTVLHTDLERVARLIAAFHRDLSASGVLELKVCVSPPSQDLFFASRTLYSEHSVLHLGPRMPEQSQLAGVMAFNWLESVCMVVGSQLTLWGNQF